jgi:hypothetical protein
MSYVAEGLNFILRVLNRIGHKRLKMTGPQELVWHDIHSFVQPFICFIQKIRNLSTGFPILCNSSNIYTNSIPFDGAVVMAKTQSHNQRYSYSISSSFRPITSLTLPWNIRMHLPSQNYISLLIFSLMNPFNLSKNALHLNHHYRAKPLHDASQIISILEITKQVYTSATQQKQITEYILRQKIQ